MNPRTPFLTHAGTIDGYRLRRDPATLVAMDDRYPSQSTFAPGYGTPGSYGESGYGAAGYPPAGYAPGLGIPGDPGYGGLPPGMYPPGYNPWLGTFAGPRYASVWRRIVAQLIDGLILGIVNMVAQLIFMAFVSSGRSDSESGLALVAYVVFVFVLDGLYFVLQEGSSGQTLGKRVLGIQVVKADGSQMDVDAALIRYIFLFFSFVGLGGLVTVMMVALSDTKQRIGDRVAGTIVVRAR